jgi:L-lactate utilization protein LutB
MYNSSASIEEINATVEALKKNGIEAIVAKNSEDAKDKTLAMIPLGAQVMTMTSVTLDSLSITKEINESGDFDSIRKRFEKMDPKKDRREMKMLGSAPEYAIGSVHAVTQDGKVVIASNSGSQLSAYVYGADRVIWVVGTQKIVKDMEEAQKRIHTYVLPLESERANKAYNITTGSFVSKELIVNREITPGRISIVFVPEVIGF